MIIHGERARPRPLRIQEPLHPVESLIDHHKRKARSWINGARVQTWSITQPWHYHPADRHELGDVAATLDAAATERRVVAALLALRRARVTHIRVNRWRGLKNAVITMPPPARPLLVVRTGHGVLTNHLDGYDIYPVEVAGLYVGEVWRNPNRNWWASWPRHAGDVGEPELTGPHGDADAAAYAAGWIIADH